MPLQYNPTESRFLTVAQSRTNNGQKDIRIILDIPTNDFYSLDDDGNFNLIGGGGGSQTLSQVLIAGNSTGDNTIISPNTLSELGIIDGQVYFTSSDAANYQSYMVMQPNQVLLNTNDVLTNDACNISLGTYGASLYTIFNGGLSQNTINVNTTETSLEHYTAPSQSQKIFVDSDSCNMRYDDSINLIEVELGLTTGFRATQTVANGDFNNYIGVKFDKVNMVFDDIIGGNQFEYRVDVNGFYMKNLPAYQDDAAAGTAGLPQGYLYQTDGTGVGSPFDVPGVLMVKQ